MTTIAPYGAWASPISAADVAEGEALVEWIDFVGDELWWVRTLPGEGGRGALVAAAPDGPEREVLGPAWNVRSRVIEYGGRPWAPLGGPTEGFVFVHWDDQRVYRCGPGGEPVPISPSPHRPGGSRYCDFTPVGDEVWCLREEFADPSGTAVRRALVALPLDGRAARDPGEVRVLAASHHLMTGPRPAPDGRHVAWIGWNHPDMPWDTTEVMCAPVGPGGAVGEPRRVAGGDGVSVLQAEWAPDRPGVLHLLADPGGWWNLHELTLDGGVRELCPRPEEFGDPLWRIGARWFVPLADGRLAVTHGTYERRLGLLDPRDGSLRDITAPYTEWTHLATDGHRVAALGSGPHQPRAVVRPALPERRADEPMTDGVRADVPGSDVVSADVVRHAAYLPRGRHEVFEGPDGEDVHAFVYLPRHPGATAPDGELPPFLVQVHGGPTTRSHLVVRPEIAFFTSRGIGVVDVQYSGSTGYGRPYRERLRGRWGVADVRDCATVARGLIARGVADPERIGIRGGSAGGWTAAASLAAEPGLYRAAGIYYPLLDPERWSEHGTHDFESRYLDSLIGPWPQARARYAAVSPLRRAHEVRAPLVIMQGADDAVCPPVQSERFLERLRDNGVPCGFLLFDGEQHGFRRAATIETCLEAELALYAEVFGFTAPTTGKAVAGAGRALPTGNGRRGRPPADGPDPAP